MSCDDPEGCTSEELVLAQMAYSPEFARSPVFVVQQADFFRFVANKV